MQRVVLYFFISMLHITANAQNWSVFNPSYRYNYSLEHEGYTTAVVFADSTLTSGSDLIYSLNRIVTKCDTCHQSVWHAPDGTDTSYWMSNQPQFLQRRIIYSGQDYRLSDTSNYLIKHLEPVGSPWLFNAAYSVTAQIQSKTERTVFGITDSVKIILLSTADTILLSKQFGLIKYPAEFGHQKYYKLRGIENKASYTITALYGEKVPNYYDFFKLKTGSKQYYSTQQATSGSWNTCANTLYGIKTVLSSSLTGTVITNTIRNQRIGCPTTAYPACPVIQGGCDPGILHFYLSNPYSNINALQTSTVQGTPTIVDYDTIYNTGYNNQLKESENNLYNIVKFGMTTNAHFYKSYGTSCFASHMNNRPIESNLYDAVNLVNTSHPNIFFSFSFTGGTAHGILYVDEYGQVSNYGVFFESASIYCTSLIIDGNDSLGNADALTLGLNEVIAHDAVTRVYPNPARYDLTVLIPYEAQTHGYLTLTDALGNSLKTIKINGEETLQLSMEPYASGIYFLKIESPKYSRTFKVIRD